MANLPSRACAASRTHFLPVPPKDINRQPCYRRPEPRSKPSPGYLILGTAYSIPLDAISRQIFVIAERQG